LVAAVSLGGCTALDFSVGALSGDDDGASDSGAGGQSFANADGPGETGDNGVRFDVSDDDGPVETQSCSGVDLLFVVDNSTSMIWYQEALGFAFPEFVDTMVASLPPNTDLHVGVTSTEMGYSSNGIIQIQNDVCQFEGENGNDEYDYYVTPDVTDTGRNGAQGRLYLPPETEDRWIAFNTSDPPQDLVAAKDWFSRATAVGDGGSNVKMLTAPVGWVAHPANAGPGRPNFAFLRDEGTVTVVFFMHDGADMTPSNIDGKETGAQMLDMLAAAKSKCGGIDCIVGGGFLVSNICGMRPIDHFLAGLPGAPQVVELPDKSPFNDPQETADAMNDQLFTVLADVIAEKCDEIPPAG